MKAIVFTLLASLIFACSSYESKEQMALSDTMPNENAVQKNNLTVPDAYSDGFSRLIKTADYRFQVKSVKNTADVIEHLVKKYPAYISSSDLVLENPILENKMVIKVESEYFHQVLKEIDEQSVFTNHRRISTEDVSKQFIDLEARLKTKREVEQRYMDILRNKAGSVKELLEAEQQIGALHEEIESVVSRINFLKDQVKYSTINLEFYQTVNEVIASNENSFMDKMILEFSSGLNGLAKVILGLAGIWPLLIAITIGYLIYKKKFSVRAIRN